MPGSLPANLPGNALEHVTLSSCCACALVALTEVSGGRFASAQVRFLRDAGFLHVEGTTTSCAHCCWLEAEDMQMMAAAGAAVVHNPLSNLRLGSGVCQVRPGRLSSEWQLKLPLVAS